ncbi:hypothetical protein MLD38_009097 [Melastoma candidum]|nr:hypothetical protein MLD38_009097 [Melastoma candidum]
MGLAGKLMKSVFNKGRTDMNGRHGFRFGERGKWGRVTGSVPAEEDTASLQPLTGESSTEEETRFAKENIPREKPNSMSKLFQEQDAAVVIQTAFRSFMARNQRKEEMVDKEDNKLLLLPIGRDWSLNVESVDTSIEVPPAYSVQLHSETTGTEHPEREPSVWESVETPNKNLVQVPMLQQQDSSMVNQPKRKPRISVLRAKEKWDDSTVSSNVAEMRIKRRLEGMTRRERALAYAFSQQLRFCSRKRLEGEEANAGWSWLERWMATRPSESLSPLIPLGGDVGAIPSRQKCGKATGELLELASEEKESCGSNEVPLNIGSFSIGSGEEMKKMLQSKNKLKSYHKKSKQNAELGVRKFR